jgi:hypothetical protein
MLQHQYDNYLNSQSSKLLKFWVDNEIKPVVTVINKSNNNTSNNNTSNKSNKSKSNKK